MNRKVPRYYFTRVYLIAILVYVLLLIPVNIFLWMKYLPEFAESNKKLEEFLNIRFNSDYDPNTEKSAFEQGKETAKVDSAKDEHFKTSWKQENEWGEDGHFSGSNSVFFPFLLIALVLLIIYNRPFRRYFRKLRKGKPIPDHLSRYCQKHLLQAPLVNTALLFLPFLTELIHTLYLLANNIGPFGEPVFQDIIRKTITIDIFAAILVSMFSYLWLKSRVQLRYIDFVYDQDQLREGVFKEHKSYFHKSRKSKFHRKLWFSSVITTLMPLAMVIFYLIASFRAVDSLGIEEFTRQHNQILLGPYTRIVENFEHVDTLLNFYINAIDSMLLLFGVAFSTVVALIYLSLVGKWNARLIVMPVNELLEDMQRTSKGELESYSIVRSSDEIGQLTRGYNQMVSKLKENFDALEDMNRNLEKKVKERTAEIMKQKEEIQAQRDEITQQRDLLSVKNREINDSIHYASRIQEAMLPMESQFRKHLPSHFIYFKPRDIVSGDFYWIKKTGDHIIFTASDCTGHGVPGAFMSLLGMAFLNEVVTYQNITQPSLILSELRKKVKSALKQETQDNTAKDGMDMALVTLNQKTRQIQYAGAYNPLYIIRNGELQRIKADRMPIGVHRKEKPEFTNHTLQLNPGDTIYLTSDGYIDQFGGEKNEKFKSGRFRKLLQGIYPKTMEEQEAELDATLTEWMGSNAQLDDIIVIGVRV